MDKQCRFCRWWADETEVCVNDASEHLADFTSGYDTCEEWEPAAEQPNE